MATHKQFEANRRNAQKSTGPKTPEGKAAVSMNALRHGLRARTVVLPGEDREDFHQLCNDLEVEWHPQSRTEQFYVEQMAVSQWKLARMEIGESAIFQDVEGSTGKLPFLDRLWQAQSRMERSYARAQRELERLQNSRRQPDEPPEEPLASAVGQAVPPVEETPSATASPAVEPTSEIRSPTSSCIMHLKENQTYVQGYGSQERNQEAQEEKTISSRPDVLSLGHTEPRP